MQERKLAMVYFSNKPFPQDTDLDQLEKVRKLKETCKENKIYYNEFLNENELYQILYDHIQIKMDEGRFRPTFDSDIMAKIKDDDELAKQISSHFPLAARNLLEIIVDEKRSDIVWDALVNKLAKSPADLRDSLYFLARRSAFKHYVYEKGYLLLAKKSQADFGKLYSMVIRN